MLLPKWAVPCAWVYTPAFSQPGTKAAGAYGEKQVEERHRHRWEFNNAYREEFEKAGMIFSGISPDGLLVEIAELKDHPYMVGSQFHPEFLSRPMRPHPLFVGLLKAAGEKAGFKKKSELYSKTWKPTDDLSEINQME